MTTDHRAPMWLLSPIALQILDYLDDADDAHAFLTAAPNESLDDALDALRALLAVDAELPLWPTAHIASLDAAYDVSPSSVMKALPLFRKIFVTCGQDYAKICHTTKLPPTTIVSASIDAAMIRGVLGKWLPNLAALRIVSQSALAASAVIKDNLSACDGLQALTMDQYEVLLQDTLDTALAVVVEACPRLERVRLRPSSLSTASDYAALLAWLALPTSRHMALDRTEPKGELCAKLMTAMLASTTLETIELLEVPIFIRAVLSSSSPPLPRQLRHLTIKDDAKYDDYDSYDEYDSNDDDSDDAYDEADIDEVDDVPMDPAPLLGDADVAALAAKVATSRLQSLALHLEARCDVTSVMTILPPTLTKLALQTATLTSFPPLVSLWHLELWAVRFSDEAIASLAAWLRSFPKLILHFLDDADDAYAFLQAEPNEILDDALNALRTLLAMDLQFQLWPTPVWQWPTTSVPAQDCWSICHNTVLPPTTVVSAEHLGVLSPNKLSFTSVFMDNVSACHGLRALTSHPMETLDQATFDAALTAVVATWPQLERIHLVSPSLSHMSDCQSLLAWLALPAARDLVLHGTDFRDELGAKLATAMLTSRTLETIELIEVASLTRAVLSPSSPPLPQQLRHLKIDDHMLMEFFAPPPVFGEADMTALTAKITNSHLESLHLGMRTRCDATSVLSVLPQLPALTKLALQGVHLTSFPPLRHLGHLELRTVTFSDTAIESLAAFLGSSPKLVQLDLGHDPLPDPHANIVFGALPQWLSRRGTACEIRLAITSDVCADAFATALAQTRNSHKVTITIVSAILSLAAMMQLVAALASTSRLALVFNRGGLRRAEEDTALEAYGREQRLRIIYRKVRPGSDKQTWFHPPCASAR
ncbi:hypothetical protein SDRG_08195 [Saprolegnia diclina VS20]|uniref:Uncharacterized protein n=1 Tax=Saprolegnia diclina (strain VS20) TaxID=1156394 RepID=T0QKV3_SAPDV|nr:hypothetical protein SDRG_08195 [Saprolegnia diclina VS20]EQC34425.1 hypothetical protein SDRG_08195 [Saprolegnia diclina VS20]|eukprot:XP_008612287.1 hypothetical protein SDRG_08195 [Saprolegnia diclina VS20]